MFDLLVGESLACVGLLKPPLNLGEEQEALHGILVGGVFGQALNSPQDLLLCRHMPRIARVPA